MSVSPSSKHPQLTLDVVFYGMAGAGKTTQAQKIAEFFGARFFSIGTTMRALAQQNSPLGHLVNEHTQNGTFPDDATHAQIYAQAYTDLPPSQKIVFEGVGRLPRLKTIVDQLEQERNRKYLVVHLRVPEEIALQRILAQKDRNDQTPEAIAHRLEVYQETTLPILALHAQERPLLEIDASADLETVFDKIKTALLPFTSQT